MEHIKNFDQEVYAAMQSELKRQKEHVELIASENFVSKAVMEAQGSVLTNKYAEGYPHKRYYGGCEFVDMVEDLARDRVKQLFNVKYANVQPHSGSQANAGAYRAVINHGDTVMGLALDQGGHLTHGHPMNFSGVDYKFVPYFLDPHTETIDYDAVLKIAKECKPKLIVAGASAYPREIDFKRFRQIADAVGAKLMVDMAHIAGLVAAGLHNNPCDHADIVTSTTHKTLRGPRGGIILTNNEEIANIIDKQIFPGIQGGPLMHVIAAKAVAFKEALEPEFKEYQAQVIKNTKALSDSLKQEGFRIITGGTDNHLILVEVKSTTGLTGKVAEALLGDVNITCNKNTIPNDPEKPFITSGIRLGAAAVTSRGFNEEDMIKVGKLISRALKQNDNPEALEAVKQEVLELTASRPLPY